MTFPFFFHSRVGTELEAPTLYKRLSIFIRALHIIVRTLPAYKIFRKLKRNELPVKLLYKITNTETSQLSETGKQPFKMITCYFFFFLKELLSFL